MQGKMHDRVVEMRLCFFSGKVGDYKVLFKSTRKCRSTAGHRLKLLQRWVNNRIIFRSCKRFEDYDGRK